MITKVFAVLDAKVGSFGMPFYEQKPEGAIRTFGDAVNDTSNPNNMWHKHPEDFALYQVGEFDTETGELHPEIIKCLVTASALRAFGQDVSPMFDFMKNGKEQIKDAHLAS